LDNVDKRAGSREYKENKIEDIQLSIEYRNKESIRFGQETIGDRLNTKF